MQLGVDLGNLWRRLSRYSFDAIRGSMNPLALIVLLLACLVAVTACGTSPLKNYPAGMTQQEAAKQRYECEREAHQAVPAPAVPAQNDTRWMDVARMRNVCLAAKGWTD